MKSIREQLALAAYTALGAIPQAYAIDNAWDIDSSYLYYSESDKRVNVNKAILQIQGDLTDDDSASSTWVLDTMSGATPSGAVRSENSSVTTSSASGAGSSSLNGGRPDLVEFTDTRLAFLLAWAHKANRLLTVNYGSSVSVENDYQSYGASISANLDNDDRSNTYTFGGSVSYDQIFRKSGGTPVPLSRVEDELLYEKGEKYVYEAIIGIAHVFNRKTVGQLNYSAIFADGYQTDPYKVISSANVVGISSDSSFAYGEIDRFYESRPITRLRHNLFTSLAHQYGNRDEVVHITYRYYSDDWDVNAHTFDLTHRLPLSENSYIEPHIRLYAQTAANFFLHHLEDEQPLPEFASADYRLDSMKSITTGIQYGRVLNGGKLRLRIEFMNQQFENAEYGENRAVVFQTSYEKQF